MSHYFSGILIILAMSIFLWGLLKKNSNKQWWASPQPKPSWPSPRRACRVFSNDFFLLWTGQKAVRSNENVMFHPWNIEFYPTTHGHWCGNPEIGVIYTFYHPFNIHSTGIIPSIQLVAPRHGALWKTEVFWKIARRPRGLRLFTFRPWSGFSREKFHRKHPETILVFLWNIRVPT